MSSPGRPQGTHRSAQQQGAAERHPVSPGNPCPFLRALVAQGLLPDGTVPLGEVAQVIGRVARAAGRRRRVDRALMNGEWPVLLKVLGKTGPNGRYLALGELRALVEHRRLPERMRERLAGG